MWCHMPLILGPGVLDYVRAAPRVRPASKQEEHNSSPICRHELQTDDHEYESWKEREEEAEEDRKGAANAIGGGEYMHGAFKCGRRVSRPKAGSRATCRRT
ncbi:hypothetical protein PS1_016718 [Malus domestica]|uniref:uncharacterized protein isoform X2 n=1 Tax=Malus domestica TaxID=3750 RepID=UPI000498C01B|nr:uncharacterized protein LOC103455803 isoform X2 [Malus domestica]